MTQEMKAFFTPFLAENGITLTVGFLGKELFCASLSPVPDKRSRKTYTDGDAMETHTYSLRVRFPYGVSGAVGVEPFFEKLQQYVRVCNRESRFPDMPEQCFAVALSCELPQKAESVSGNSCVYSADIQITYYSMYQKGSIT